MAKAVAVDGDVAATAGTTPYTGAQSGTWTPGPVTCTSYAKLTVAGTKTVWKAECTFSFSGVSAGGSSVAGTSKVTLQAGSTKLQGRKNNVLLNGDEASDSYGNKLKASATGRLHSA